MATLLQSRSTNPNTGTTANLNFSSACTSGSTFVGFAYGHVASGTPTLAMSDATNGTWTKVGSPQNGAGGLATFWCQIFYFSNNAATTAVQTTFTISGGTSPALNGFAIHEYSGNNTLEGSGAYNNGTSPASTTSLTPSLSTDFAFSGCIFGNTESATTYTLRENANFGSNGTADKLSVTGGVATSCTWTDTTAGSALMMGHAIFTPAGSTFIAQPHQPYCQAVNRAATW